MAAKMILVIVGAAVGAMAVQPIADALATPVVGGAVPTRLQDLGAYLVMPGDLLPRKKDPALVGPIAPTDPTQAGNLRELAALSFAGGAVVAALSYAVLSKVLG